MENKQEIEKTALDELIAAAKEQLKEKSSATGQADNNRLKIRDRGDGTFLPPEETKQYSR